MALAEELGSDEEVDPSSLKTPAQRAFGIQTVTGLSKLFVGMTKNDPKWQNVSLSTNFLL